MSQADKELKAAIGWTDIVKREQEVAALISKRERELIDRIKLHKNNPLLSKAKQRDANNLIDYIVTDLDNLKKEK